MKAHASLLLGALGIAPLLIAQRSPMLATVVDERGQPVAGAEVTCCFVPGMVAIGNADLVTAATDARGRARLALRVGFLYDAWAVGKPGEDGACQVTCVTPLVHAGRVVELRTVERRMPRKVRLAGLAPWRSAGAHRLRWYPDGIDDARCDFALPDGNELVLPPGPRGIGSLCLCDESGEVLVAVGVRSHEVELAEFAPPMAIQVRGVTPEGLPVAGVRVEHPVSRNVWPRRLFRAGSASRAEMRLAAVTDAAGEARFHVPEPQATGLPGRMHVPPLVLHAIKAGFATQHEGVTESRTVEFVLPARERAELRIVGGWGGLQLAAWTGFVITGGRGIHHGSRSVDLEPHGRGRWLLESLERGFTLRFAVHGTPPTAFAVGPLRSPGGSWSVDLAQLRTVDVCVFGPDGGPAVAALAAAEVSDGNPIYWHALLATDPSGRANLRLGPGAGYVYATTGDAHGLALTGEQCASPLRIDLVPIPRMRVQVVRAGGLPIAGATLRGVQSTSDARSADLAGRQWDRLAGELWRDYLAFAHSDVQGILSAPAFLRPGLRAKVEVVRDGESSGLLDLEPGETSVVLR